MQIENIPSGHSCKCKALNPSLGKLASCIGQVDEFRTICAQFMNKNLSEGASMKQATNESQEIARHMRDVEQTANQIYQQQQAQLNNALNSPYQNYMFPRQLRNRTRLDNAIQSMYPRKVQAEERRYRYLPVSDYRYDAHRNKLSPLTQIYNAYHMPIDTSQWQRNRNNFSRLYKSLRDAEISHQDMLAVVGNPYIRVVKDWRDIPWTQKQTLLQEHPEMPELSMFLEKTKSEFKAITPVYRSLNLHEQRIVDEGIEDLSFWFIPALPAKIPAGLKVAYATFKAKVPQIANAYSTKLEFVRNIVNFFKKKAKDGLKKGEKTTEKRTIPTHDKQREFIEKKLSSGEWKKMKGRFMFEDEKGRRFAPTKEKFEFEVGEKKWKVGTHRNSQRRRERSRRNPEGKIRKRKELWTLL